MSATVHASALFEADLPCLLLVTCSTSLACKLLEHSPASVSLLTKEMCHKSEFYCCEELPMTTETLI